MDLLKEFLLKGNNLTYLLIFFLIAYFGLTYVYLKLAKETTNLIDGAEVEEVKSDKYYKFVRHLEKLDREDSSCTNQWK